jgi:hypothetical protein
MARITQRPSTIANRDAFDASHVAERMLAEFGPVAALIAQRRERELSDQGDSEESQRWRLIANEIALFFRTRR